MRHGISFAAAVALAAAVAGCSSGSGGKAHVAATNGHPDPAAIADKFGCSNYQATTDTVELFAATEGDCDYGSGSVTILTFASSSSFSKWQAASKAGSGGDGTSVIGDRYAIETDNADEASTIASSVGGTTQ